MGCPCGKGFNLESCCGRFLSGEAWPLTAEELMRSRFSAFATGQAAYLEETHDPDTFSRPYKLDQAVTWERLEVLETESGEPEDEHGVVEFKAYYKRDGHAGVLHERSTFRRQDGRWVYTRGKQPSARSGPRVGRNDPCPCGSGLKFKKCCGNA